MEKYKMAQTPYHFRFVSREVPEPGHTIPPVKTRTVLIPQQFLPVKQFSESKGRVVEFWTWKDIPLCDPSTNEVLVDAVQIPLSR